jgi:hypothetical protein
MSRSNNTELTNPAQQFYEWVGSKGCLRYFDKSKGEKGENVLVKLPFTFLVLDRLSSIKGFSERDNSSFWSNEVRDIKNDTLSVRTKKGVVATGLYDSLAHVLNQGACYNQSVYIAIKKDNDFVIVNLALHGSAIGEWIELCKRKNVYKGAITISEGIPMKKGATSYFAPKFKINPEIKPETEERCIALDKELQEYLKAYFNRSRTEQQENLPPSAVITDRQRQDIASFKPDTSGNYDEINSQINEDTFVEVADDLPF